LLIIPVFAFANTNISFTDDMVQGLFSPLGLGISLGLILGKPVGIVLTSFICAKLHWGQLPDNSNLLHIIGVGFLAGIGFTMSIFISMLSFDQKLLIEEAKLSVLLSSLIAGVIGYLLLRFSGTNKNKRDLS
jgi:NhaA family Na+:H+ antiporter